MRLADVEDLTLDQILPRIDIREAVQVYYDTRYLSGDGRHNDRWKAEEIAEDGPFGRWNDPPPVPLGTWRIEPTSCELEVLIEVEPADLVISEGDHYHAMSLPCFPFYVEWAMQGHRPPPITTIRNVDTHRVMSLNRRRTLAAIKASRKLWAWHTESRGFALFSWWQAPREQVAAALAVINASQEHNHGVPA